MGSTDGFLSVSSGINFYPTCNQYWIKNTNIYSICKFIDSIKTNLYFMNCHYTWFDTLRYINIYKYRIVTLCFSDCWSGYTDLSLESYYALNHIFLCIISVMHQSQFVLLLNVTRYANVALVYDITLDTCSKYR